MRIFFNSHINTHSVPTVSMDTSNIISVSAPLDKSGTRVCPRTRAVSLYG